MRRRDSSPRARPIHSGAARPENDGSELPEGWTTVRLPDIAELVMGQSPPSTTYNTGQRGLPFFQGKAEFGELYPTPHKFCDTPGKIAEPDDILMTIRAPVGPTNLCATRSCIGRGLAAIRARGEVPPLYLLYFFRSIEEWLSRQGTGSTFTAINKDDLSSIELPLAPLAEQRRIVGKLELLLGKVSSSQQRLSRVPGLLKRFRQSVLAAACSGKLTADWREESDDVEPASALIAEARFQLLEDVAELPELPASWAWVPLGNYARCSRGRFLVRPRNDPSYFGGPYPFIQIGNLPPEGGCITSHTQTLNEKGLRVSKMFPKGTVAIAIVGATIGNTGFLGYDMCFTDSMVGLETGSEAGNRYVEFFLRHRKNDIREASYAGGGQPNIKLDTLNPYPLALPPLAEEQEIVRRVEKLFAFADQIEARLTQAQTHVARLTQSLLAKAFRGELVPTEAALARREGRDYEPAGVLLDRIRRERENQAASDRPRGAARKRGAKLTAT